MHWYPPGRSAQVAPFRQGVDAHSSSSGKQGNKISWYSYIWSKQFCQAFPNNHDPQHILYNSIHIIPWPTLIWFLLREGVTKSENLSFQNSKCRLSALKMALARVPKAQPSKLTLSMELSRRRHEILNLLPSLSVSPLFEWTWRYCRCIYYAL